MAMTTVRTFAFRRGTTQLQPLVRQALLVLLVALDAVLHQSASNSISLYYLLGLAVLLAASLWTVLSSVPATSATAGAAVLVLDLAAVGLMRLVPEGNGLGFLAVFVALWLGVDHRGRGVLLSLLGSTLLVALPSLLYFGTADAWLSRALLLTLTAVVCAVTTASASRMWAEQTRELEDQGRRLQEALEAVVANRALNDAIVSTVDVGLVSLNRSGEYRTMNPRHTAFMELAFPDGHDGMAGQDGFVFAADRETRLTRDEMPSVRAMQGEEFTDYVIWVGEDPARQRALSVSAGPVVDDNGELDGAVLVYKDITELMSALKVKDEFVASVSHELRTPLTVVMGYVDLVLSGSLADDRVNQHLQVVRRNAQRLLRMVDDLLLTAHSRQGRLVVDLRDVDLTGLVAEALADLETRAEAAGVTVESHLAGPVMVSADHVRMRQVVDNLLSNAVKYTPAGGTVTVRLDPLADAVDLVVVDSGIGISAEDQARLFTKFFRSPEAEARAIPGIGLGLAITSAIVEAHHGTISVSSESGRGSRFTVRLPLRTIRTLTSEDPGRKGATSPVATNPALV
jgi:signal transduction histidine kinase